jgi:AraC-like DNA-binding protein
MPSDTLSLTESPTITALGGGLFVSRGIGTHVRRVIDSVELIFLAKGALEMEENGVHFSLVAGQSLILFPDREHAGLSPYTPDCSFYWVHFRCPAPANTPSLTVPQSNTVARPEVLTGLFRRYLDDQEARLLTPQTANYLLLLMLHEVTRPTESRAVVTPSTPLARYAHQYILSHWHEPNLSSAIIASALDCHPDYLGRCFRQEWSKTMTKCIQEERIKHARQMLMNTHETVDRIAHACGFGTALYFRRLFHRYEGMTPTQFRSLYARVFVNTD